MFSLKDKTALITGATGGIGKAIALTYAQSGCNLVLSATNEERLSNFRDEILSKYSNIQVEIVPANLSNLQEAEGLFNKASSLVSKIEILVCNAGITRDTLSIKMSNQDWHDVLDVNLNASFLLCRSALQSMFKKKYGRIINISSVIGLKGNIGQVNYSTSKAGLIGMTKSFAIEYAKRNITVNAIAPGYIETAMTNEVSDMVADKIRENIPSNSFGTPQDVAYSALFLASEEASYITGQTLHVNGGLLMP